MKSILVLSLLLEVAGSGSVEMAQSPGTFTATGNIRTERMWHTATLLPNGKVFSEESLRTALQNFVAHYHAGRNHQGLANQLISPEPDHLNNAGEVQRRQRLGGLLNYYYRAAA